MFAIVTGVAGFIGSHLAEALLDEGHSVKGVDCFTPYYARSVKEANLARARSSDRFEFIEADLRDADVDAMIDEADVVFHQAAQAGVRPSWANQFADYATHNIVGTQRLLEGCRHASGKVRFVYASSSSIYGNATRYPTVEDDLPAPHSPYGVTKLAAEHLCGLYAANWGLETVSLRYFTVYGPRQRPDMAIHRLIESARLGEAFPLFGDGGAVRDFTFVDDVVKANLAAAEAAVEPGTVVNIAGGSSISMSDLIDLVGDVVGTEVPLDRHETQPGDVARTGGAIDRAHAVLGWEPRIDLRKGIELQAAWHSDRAGSAG